MKQYYRPAARERQGYGSVMPAAGESPTCNFASGFAPSDAGPYPDIESELKKSVVMLASSIEARNIYIDDLRKTRDSLITELDLKEVYIDSLIDSLKSYQAFFSQSRLKKMPEKNSNSSD